MAAGQVGQVDQEWEWEWEWGMETVAEPGEAELVVEVPTPTKGQTISKIMIGLECYQQIRTEKETCSDLVILESISLNMKTSLSRQLVLTVHLT